MADLSSTKIYGTLTVVHDAILKANAEITGNVNVTGTITGDGSGLTGIGGGATISDSAPASPSSGEFWWDSSDGNLYVYYNDGTSSQWVTSVTPMAGPRGPKGNTGDAATITVGTVSTTAAGTSATITNSGTVNDAIFDFTVPKGDTGDTGPNPLDVLDAWQTTSDTVERLYFASNSHTYLRTGNDIIFRNSADSNIATFSSAGNIVATGDVTAYSDERMKMDIEVIPDAIDKVNRLNGYTFNRTDMDGRHTGVIAQEVLDVLPEAVMGGPTEEDPDGKYSVAYGNMVGLLVEAVKEQQKQIDELKRRLG